MIKIDNTYLGFTDNMKPMNKVKVENLLDKLIRADGEVLTEKQWVYSKLLSGYTVSVEENYRYWTRLGNLSKPKTLYKLNSEDNSYFEISKTLYNFALYVLDKGLTNQDILNQFFKQEDEYKNLKMEDERAREEAVKKARELENQKYEEFQEWLKQEIDSYGDENKVKIMTDIFNSNIGHITTKRVKEFLVYVDNIENNQCRQALKNILHIGNPTSKKVFHRVTGINIGQYYF